MVLCTADWWSATSGRALGWAHRSGTAQPFFVLFLFLFLSILSPAAEWDDIRKGEAVRKHGALHVGSRVSLGPIDRDNWNPDQNRFVGATTKVTELVSDTDVRGCYGVRVEIDGGIYFWRVRNLAGQGLRSGQFLDCLRLEGTDIPLCVIPLRNETPLVADPTADAMVVGKVPIYERIEANTTWYLPRQLYVNRRDSGFLRVMESDFGSEEALGWIEEAGTVTWPTRQGYVINRGRASRSQLLGYASLDDVGDESKAVYREDMDSFLTPDPNATSMCEGLLLRRRTVRGMELVQCVITPVQDAERKVVWFPFSRAGDELLPYVLMSKLDLIELSGNFALLYAACFEGYADQIRTALEEDWDLEAKIMTGDKKRVQKYARFFKQVQRIYPALTRRLALPPGETSEREFEVLGERAAQSQANVQRLIDAMDRDARNWAWVKISDL